MVGKTNERTKLITDRIVSEEIPEDTTWSVHIILSKINKNKGFSVYFMYTLCKTITVESIFNIYVGVDIFMEILCFRSYEWKLTLPFNKINNSKNNNKKKKFILFSDRYLFSGTLVK
jgi:hypothetical protein